MADETDDAMPPAFADAVCNVHQKAITVAGMDDALRVDLLDRHSGGRYRSAPTGVACDACRARAQRIWVEYRRILSTLSTTEGT